MGEDEFRVVVTWYVIRSLSGVEGNAGARFGFAQRAGLTYQVTTTRVPYYAAVFYVIVLLGAPVKEAFIYFQF